MSSELPHQRVREECEEELQLQLKSWWRDNEQGKKLWQMGKKKKEKKNPSNPTLLPRDAAAKTEQCGCTGWCCLATSAKWTLPGSSDKKLEARAHAHTQLMFYFCLTLMSANKQFKLSTAGTAGWTIHSYKPAVSYYDSSKQSHLRAA